MVLEKIKERLVARGIYYSDDSINGRSTKIGYDKQFRWSWMATQLNTFIVAVDFGVEEVTVATLEDVMNEAYGYSKQHYNGWPRGLQSGIGVIVILISENVSQEAIDYCNGLKAGKKWAGFSIPVAIDATTQQAYFFKKYQMWGRIYFPYFDELIKYLTSMV